MQKRKLIGKLIFAISGVFLLHPANGQKNVVSGQIITLSRDTVAGYIDYRNWERNPTSISFLKSPAGEPLTYTPYDILEFMVEDERYVSATVDREVTPTKISRLEYDPSIRLETTTAFLQTLVRGPKSLYHLRDGDGKDQFYIRKNDVYQLLIYKRYFVTQNGENVITEKKRYIGQLQTYLKDCPSIASRVRNIKYGKNSLEKLFLHYYDCTQSGVEFHKKTERMSLEFGPLAGVSFTSLQFKGEDLSFLTEADYSRSAYGTAGLFLDLILPRNQKKWAVGNELIFTSYDIEGYYLRFSDESHYNAIETKIGYSYIKLNNMLRFRYPIRSIFLYVNAGISNGLAVSGENSLKEEAVSNSVREVIERPILAYIRKYEQGYIIGLGAQYKRCSFEIRYERGNGISPYRFVHIPVSRYYGLLKYKLF